MSLSVEALLTVLGGRPRDQEAAVALAAHHAELVRWNRTHNLTRVGEGEALERHYLDAVRGFSLIETWFGTQGWPLPGRVLDVGSGAGFPGFVGAVLWPDTRFTLLDSSAKRCSFLRYALGRSGVAAEVVHARAEEAPGRWPLVVSRATVQPMEAGLVVGLAEPGGCAALWVGGSAVIPGSELLQAGETRIAILRST